MPSWRSTRAFVLCFAPAAAVRCEIGDVVIVGAGASGIAMAKAFTQRGCRSITIYEKAHTVGGHWAWAPNYVGVGVQNKRDAYRFSDKAMAGDGPRANAADVVAYLQDYARERGFSQQIRLGMEVEEVVEAEAAGGRRELMVRDVKTGERSTHAADIVVLAAGITPHLPSLPSPQDASVPKVVHSSGLDAALVGETVAARRRVVVVGGGKSASECVACLRDAGLPASCISCVAASPSTCATFEPQLWPRSLQLPFSRSSPSQHASPPSRRSASSLASCGCRSSGAASSSTRRSLAAARPSMVR